MLNSAEPDSVILNRKETDRPMLNRILRVAVVVIIALQAAAVSACSVPVFRYALEQWQADNLQIVVFHRGELSAEQQALVARIEPKDLDAKFVANVWIKTVDLDEAQDKDVLALWETQSKAKASESLPWMVVLPPPKSMGSGPVLSAPFTDANVDNLLDSPARAELAKRLIKGDSVVWILLEGGTKDKDAAAAEILTSELKRLETVIEPPEIDPEDIADGSDPGEIKIKFSVIRVSRDDPKEKSFVDMLLATEPDLRDAEFDGEPMALPVFGRARSLYALIAKGINAETVEDASRFLTGACQCTIKAQNPGVDLLTSPEWDRHVDGHFKPDTSIPTLVGLGGFEKQDDTEESANTETASATTVPSGDEPDEGEATSAAAGGAATAGAATTAPARSSSSMPRMVFILFGALALVVVGVSLTVGSRS
jgi:hypothetical protein